jgi:hypothetical protein
METQVNEIFAANKAVKELYVFEDGNIFSNKNFALNHQRSVGEKFTTVTRSGSISNNPLVAQLLSLDFNNPDGKLYKEYKALHDGLGLQSQNAKMPTLVEALKAHQLTLTTK